MQSNTFSSASINRLNSPVDLNRMTIESPALTLRSAVAPEGVHGVAKRSRKGLWLLALVTVAVLGAAVYARIWNGTAESNGAAAHSGNDPQSSVQTVRATRAVTSNVVLPASVRPWQTATLHARASGYLIAWHKDLGATVKAGELLAELETPELDQEVAVAEALAHEAAAAAVQSKAERIEAEADLKVAEAQLVRIRAETVLSRTQLARREKLVSTRAIAKEEYDTFVTQLESRNAEVAAAESDVVRRRTNLDTRTAIIEARAATAESRLSSVERLKELQDFKRIVAPFDGVVTRRNAEVGMLVTAGKEALFVVEDMSRVRVQMQVPQTYSMLTAPGVEASIAVPESAAPPTTGTITRIAESVDTTNRTMLAEIELENGSRRFQPGNYAQVTLIVPQGDAAWTIPANTVSMRVEGPHVAALDDQNRIELKRITLGRDLGTKVVVLAGIRGDERLIVNPGDSLVDGALVQSAQSSEADPPNIAQR